MRGSGLEKVALRQAVRIDRTHLDMAIEKEHVHTTVDLRHWGLFHERPIHEFTQPVVPFDNIEQILLRECITRLPRSFRGPLLRSS